METIGIILSILASVGLLLGLYYANQKRNLKKSISYIGGSYVILAVVFFLLFKN
jgi:hypothetical protein